MGPLRAGVLQIKVSTHVIVLYVTYAQSYIFL